ncbi:MAG: hypothetical protein H7Z75_09960 [Ferruginibacter sp.]|nr:hypothetical protein [Cytophagales bacterium]
MDPTASEVKPTQPGQAANHPTDFKRLFLASSGNFLVDENPQYRLEADHARKLIFLVLSQTWRTFAAVPSLEEQLRSLASATVGEFGMLIDMSSLSPDADGVLLAPAIPARGTLLDAGLTKVANVIPYNCQELIHGPHSLSVNSVKMRPFNIRFYAENWLTSDQH